MAEVKVVISGEDRLSPVFNKASQSIKSNVDSWIKMAGGMVAAWLTVEKALESMKLAAAAQQAEASFRSVAESFNVNADKMLAKMKEVSRGMIDDSDLMQKAVQGFMLGLDDKKMIGLLDASRSAAKVWGQDVATTFDTLITAVGGGVRAMGPLVRMGLVTKEEFQDMNKAIANGAEEMDMYALVSARATLQMARLSNAELDAKERSQAFHAQIKNLQETIGGGLIWALQKALAAAQFFGVGIAKILELYARLGAENPFNSAENQKGWAARADYWKKEADALEKIAKANAGLGGPRPDDSEERKRKAADAQKVVDDFDKKLKALAEGGAGQKLFDDLSRGVEEFSNKLIGLDPNLSETEKKLRELYAGADELITKIDQSKVSEKVKAELIDKVLDTIDKGAEMIKTEGTKKMADAYSDLMAELGTKTEDAREKDLATLDQWLVEKLRKYEDNEGALEKIKESYASQQAAITEKYNRLESEGYVEMLGAVKEGYDKASEVIREFGETDLEYTKRILAEQGKWVPLLENVRKAFEVMGMTGTKESDEIIKRLKSFNEEQKKVTAGFAEGWSQGIKEYTEELNNGFNRGKEMARDFARNVEDALVTMFDDPKKAIDDLGKYFMNTLKRMAAQALMTPIMVQMQGVSSGSASQMIPGMGGIGNLLGAPGQLLTGGLAALFPGSQLVADFATGIFGGFGAGGGILGAVGAAMPYLAAIPLLVSLIGGLFKGKPKIPQLQVGMGGSPPDMQYGGSMQQDQWWFATGGGGEGITDQFKSGIMQAFEDIRVKVKDVFKDMGLAVDGFEKEWQSKMVNWKDMTEEQMQAALKDMMGEYIQFASGVDFSQFKQGGETLIDTINRVLGSLMNLKPALEQIAQAALNFAITMQSKIDQLLGTTGTIPLLTQGMADQKSIIDQALAGAADITNEQAMAALQGYVQYLDQWVSAGVASIQQSYAMQAEALNAQKEMIQSQIEGINRESDALNKRKKAISDEISGLQKQLQLTQQWKGVLEAVGKQISDMVTSPNLNPADYLELLGYKRQELDRMQGLYSGATGEEKMGYAGQLQQLISDYMTLAQQAYQFPSPEYQAIYDQALGWLQQIQGDAANYAQGEEDILRQIQALENESLDLDRQIEANQARIAGLNEQIAGLSQEANDMQKDMNAEIKAFQAGAAEYYKWAQEAGLKFYDDQAEDMVGSLGDIASALGAEGYLAQIETDALAALNEIKTLLGGGVPGFAEGAYVTRPTFARVAERGPEWIIPDGMSAGPQSAQGQSVMVSMGGYSPTFVINAKGNVDEKKLAEEAHALMRRSIKTGQLGDDMAIAMKKKGFKYA